MSGECHSPWTVVTPCSVIRLSSRIIPFCDFEAVTKDLDGNIAVVAIFSRT